MQELTIVKVGGNILDDAERLQGFLRDFARLPGAAILVHGGGKIASSLGQRLGITPQLVEGRRITDAATLDLVTMVYGGLINKQVVAQLQAAGRNALGLTGADANVVLAQKRPAGQIDYGFAGDITGSESINTPVLESLLRMGLTPVFAPLTHNGQGTLLNTNADTIASVLATALATSYTVRLVYCFEKPGVLWDASDEASVLPQINSREYAQLKSEGIVSDGMIPKLDNAFAALAQGVSEVLIGQAEALTTIFTGNYTGTRLRHAAE